MKRGKKLIGLLLTAAVFGAAPITASALPTGGYVPTSSTYYLQDNISKEWEESGTESFSYKRDGRLTRYKFECSDYSYSEEYVWKGDYITRYIYNYTSESEKESSTTTYKFKNNKLVSYKNSGEKAVKYKWKGKTGTSATKQKITVNEKGQLTKYVFYYDGKKNTVTYKYYADGNLKSVTTKGKDYTETRTYSRKGYKTSYSYKDGSDSTKITYKYTTKKGKIRQVLRNTSWSSDGESGEYAEKVVFSKWKNVSHVRNCDAFAFEFGESW